jgi:hypothetical protein
MSNGVAPPGTSPGLGNEHEVGLGVEVAAYDPGTGGTVDVDAGAGPLHAVSCSVLWWPGWRVLTARSAAALRGWDVTQWKRRNLPVDGGLAQQLVVPNP